MWRDCAPNDQTLTEAAVGELAQVTGSPLAIGSPEHTRITKQEVASNWSTGVERFVPRGVFVFPPGFSSRLCSPTAPF